MRIDGILRAIVHIKPGIAIGLLALTVACSKAPTEEVAVAAVGGRPDASRLATTYDAQGKLERLEYDRNGDGKPDTWGFMDGTRVVRVEVDENGDGKIDRWEFHRTDGGGAPEASGASGDQTIERVERATRFDGTVSRREFFSDGMLTRIEEDTDGDGSVDKWEAYDHGTLATLTLDTQHRGKPDRRLVYAPDGSFVRIEADVNGTGDFQPLTQ